MAPTAGEVQRFGRTERALHWVHTGAFAVMFATGAILYAPPLSLAFGNRSVIKGIHLVFAVGWLTALALVWVLGSRRDLGRTRRELERFDADDLLFLRRRPSRPARFNGGQKAHAVAEAALFVLFYVSGILLLLGERDHSLRLAGTLPLHDFVTLTSIVLVAGHILKSTGAPGSIAGMVRGNVSADYAARHHPRWQPAPAAIAGPVRVRLGTALVATAVAVAGVVLAIVVLALS
jgi:formate dehydrogenase subunit gamma